MSDFATEIQLRVAGAQRSLTEARESGDDYAVRLALGELEDLARMAADHHIPVDGVEEALAAHGLRTPRVGLPLLKLDLDQLSPPRRPATSHERAPGMPGNFG